MPSRIPSLILDQRPENHKVLPDPADFPLAQKEGMDWAVVIPVRNRADLLEKCLDSIRKQRFPNGRGEVLICDDGSTENLTVVVGRFASSLPNLRLLHQPPKGPASARNLGFRSSLAEIFVCLDSDIICAPDFLNSLVAHLQNHPEWVAAEGSVLPVGDKSPLHDAPEGRGGAYCSGASAYRAEALIKVGGFDEAFPYPACEDIDLAARLLQIGRYGYVPEAIVYHPVRRIGWETFWNWRKFWKYVMILAQRYRFLAFPGKKAGRFPRFRVALAAVLTSPGGRFLNGVKHIKSHPSEGILTCELALFDVLCGFLALKDIFFTEVPPARNYLREKVSQEN
jgi:GT2 family glycosyltransferase